MILGATEARAPAVVEHLGENAVALYLGHVGLYEAAIVSLTHTHSRHVKPRKDGQLLRTRGTWSDCVSGLTSNEAEA